MPSVKVLAIPRAFGALVNLSSLIIWIYFRAKGWPYTVFVCIASCLGLILNTVELPALVRYKRSWQSHDRTTAILTAKQLEIDTQPEYYGTATRSQSRPVIGNGLPLFWTSWRTSCVSADVVAIIFNVVAIILTMNVLNMIFGVFERDFTIPASRVLKAVPILQVTVAMVALLGVAALLHLTMIVIYILYNRRLNKRGEQEDREDIAMAEHEREDMRFRAMAVAYLV